MAGYGVQQIVYDRVQVVGERCSQLTLSALHLCSEYAVRFLCASNIVETPPSGSGIQISLSPFARRRSTIAASDRALTGPLLTTYLKLTRPPVLLVKVAIIHAKLLFCKIGQNTKALAFLQAVYRTGTACTENSLVPVRRQHRAVQFCFLRASHHSSSSSSTSSGCSALSLPAIARSSVEGVELRERIESSLPEWRLGF
jgi:hypothetical protein